MTYAEIVRDGKPSNVSTRAGRAYYALCSLAVTRGEEERYAEIATQAADVPCQPWGAWHAISVVVGRVDECSCVPCRKARGEPPMCL